MPVLVRSGVHHDTRHCKWDTDGSPFVIVSHSQCGNRRPVSHPGGEAGRVCLRLERMLWATVFETPMPVHGTFKQAEKAEQQGKQHELEL